MSRVGACFFLWNVTAIVCIILRCSDQSKYLVRYKSPLSVMEDINLSCITEDTVQLYFLIWVVLRPDRDDTEMCWSGAFLITIYSTPVSPVLVDLLTHFGNVLFLML